MITAYSFNPQQETGNVNATFKFITSFQLEYAITFVEADRIIDILDDYPILANSICLIVDVIQSPPYITPLDARVGKTIADILQLYLNTVDVNSIIIYNCDERDGKQVKRFNKFARWFMQYGETMHLIKIDKEIQLPVTTEEAGDYYISTFISFVYTKEHPRKETIKKEIIKLHQKIMGDK